jgi:hypothetical protein
VQVKKAAPLEPSSSSTPSQAEDIAIGKLRGEDYNFEFQGKVKEGKMHFRLFMTQVGRGVLCCAVLCQGAVDVHGCPVLKIAGSDAVGYVLCCRVLVSAQQQ